MSLISFVFFTLIFFQKAGMERQNHPMPMQVGPPSFYSDSFDMQQEPKEPSLIVPFFFIGGISLFFILLLLNYLNKNFISPLEQIQNNLKDIKDGKLDVSFCANSENKQVNETFSTLNDMVFGLKQRNKLQDEFIQKLSHDLRAPLVAQERAIQILKEEFENHELLDGMLENSQEYIKMINIVMQAFHNNEVKIEKTEFNFYQVINTISQNLKPLADKKNIEIINEIDKKFVLFADYISILRIFGNLISNAIENISFDKKIKISAKKSLNEAILIVEDNGSGIEEEKISTIFDKYYSGRKGDKIVSGLGLHIVKELVEKNLGNIKLESKSGSYTKFIVTLPLGVENEEN